MRNLAVLLVLLGVVQVPGVAAEPPPNRGKNLPELMARYTPPPLIPGRALDADITFDRIDVVIEQVMGRGQSPYISIARSGSYLYKLDTVKLGGKERAGANIVHRLPESRMKDLQRLLEETKWLTAAGHEGPALHTDAATMTIALTRQGKLTTVVLEGQRPAPYDALQRFFDDLDWQEDLFYRLTRLPEEAASANYELQVSVESALGRPGRAGLHHVIQFDRFYEFFKGKLDRWYVGNTQELQVAVDLTVLLEKVEQADAVSRLRFDRDLNLRSNVARALPILYGDKAIPFLVDMIESTAEARIALIRLGDVAVPTIASIIEPDEGREFSRAVALIRAYIDNWKTLPGPIDVRVIGALQANMQLENVRDRMSYHKELLKLAGVPEPKPLTSLETIESFLKHLRSGNRKELNKLKSNVGSIEKWIALGESFEPSVELALETLLIDKFSGFAMTKPFKNKAGNDVHLVVFLNALRGTDWRVSAALEEAAQKTSQKDQFLKSNPGAKEARP